MVLPELECGVEDDRGILPVDSGKVGQRAAGGERARKYPLTDPCSSDILKRTMPWLAEANAIGAEYVRADLLPHQLLRPVLTELFTHEGLMILRRVLMRRINHAAALIMLGWTVVTPAVGQDDCLASYKVNPSKSVTYLSIGSNPDDRINTMMSCSVAEAMRDEFF